MKWPKLTESINTFVLNITLVRIHIWPMFDRVSCIMWRFVFNLFVPPVGHVLRYLPPVERVLRYFVHNSFSYIIML